MRIIYSFLFAALLLLPGLSIVYGQCRLGSTAAEIMSEFNAQTFEREFLKAPWYTDDGSAVRQYISFEASDVWCAYYLDEDNVCRACMVAPKTPGKLNSMVERFNTQYVIISDQEWKAYSGNGYFHIRLDFQDGLAFFFVR